MKSAIGADSDSRMSDPSFVVERVKNWEPWFEELPYKSEPILSVTID